MMKLNPTLSTDLCRKTELILRPKYFTHSACIPISVYLYYYTTSIIMLRNHLQAYKKMNKDLKKEQIEILKTKYGIDLDKEK